MISEYDISALNEARQRLMSVYNWYFGDSTNKRFENRLGTIIDKLDKLIEIARKGEAQCISSL